MSRKREQTNEDITDDMFDYDHSDLDEIKAHVKKINGTDDYWYFIARLFMKAKNDVEDLNKRVKELEEVNEKMKESFGGRRNQYDY